MLLGFVKFIDDVSNFVSCDVSQVGFGVDDEHQDTSVIFELVDNTISATFALLDVAVFEANFEYSIAYSRDAIASAWRQPFAKKITCLELFNNWLSI